MEQALMPQSGVPVVGFTPAVVFEQQQKAEADAKAEALKAQQPSSSLLSYMQKCINDADYAKQISGITDRLLDAQRRRRGEHSAEKQSQLAKYKLPNYWVPLTQTKCIHTEAWMRDLLMPFADKIWGLVPSEIPELPEDYTRIIQESIVQEASVAMAGGEMISDMQMHSMIEKIQDSVRRAIMEEAKDRADNMERLIQDQHEDCGFTNVFRDFQSNLTTYGTAFLKGPFTVYKKIPKWNGSNRVVENKVIPSCSSPSPHDIFPAPWSCGVNDGWIIERIRTYREGLNSVRKLPYYHRKNIESLLSAPRPATNTRYGDDRRFTKEDKQQGIPDDRYEVYQFNGAIPGYMLGEWGLECDPAEDYNMEVLWCDNYILKVMPRWDDVRTTPYFKAVFKPVVGSFWGVGVPNLMSSSQDRANSMMIAMLDNTVWASGPIGWANLSRFVNPADAKDMHPHKFVATHDQPGQSGPPMGFMSVELRTSELMAQYRQATEDADNESGVPAYTYGSSSNAGGAASTYSGLQTLMNSAAKGIKDALLQIDLALSEFIRAWADWNNEYSDDESVKGDINVLCSGSTGLFVAEMRLAKYDEILNQVAPMIDLVGPRFVLDIIRTKAKELNLDHTKLPTDEELMARMMAMQQAPQGQIEAPLQPPVSKPTGEEINPETKPLTPVQPQ